MGPLGSCSRTLSNFLNIVQSTLGSLEYGTSGLIWEPSETPGTIAQNHV